MNIARDHLYIRKPTLPRPVWSLPVTLYPRDCPACAAPVPLDVTMCLQCGHDQARDPCPYDVAPQFSTS